MNIQDKLDREVLIQQGAKDGILPEHDCKLSPDSGCDVCEEYAEARQWWLEQEKSLSNEKLI